MKNLKKYTLKSLGLIALILLNYTQLSVIIAVILKQ